MVKQWEKQPHNLLMHSLDLFFTCELKLSHCEPNLLVNGRAHNINNSTCKEKGKVTSKVIVKNNVTLLKKPLFGQKHVVILIRWLCELFGKKMTWCFNFGSIYKTWLYE